jgi:hypothetical protein
MIFETKEQLITHIKKYCHVNNYLHESKLGLSTKFDVDAYINNKMNNIKNSQVKSHLLKTPREPKARMFVVHPSPHKKSLKTKHIPMRRVETVKRPLKASRVLLIEDENPVNRTQENVLVISNVPNRGRNDDSLSYDKLKSQNNKNISVLHDYINHTEKKLDFLRKSKAENGQTQDLGRGKTGVTE